MHDSRNVAGARGRGRLSCANRSGATAWASPARGVGRRFSKKGPVIGGGSQSREKRQSKSIRGRAMCRNSHTERKTRLAHESFRNRAARREARRPPSAHGGKLL